MEITSIETQKKLMFIPLLNVINFGILFLNLRYTKVSFANFIKLLLSILGFVFPICFGFSVVAKLLPSIWWVFYICTIYLGPLAMSYVSIRFQEKYL